MPPQIRIHPYTSPCGELLLGAYNGQLCLCDWLTEKHHTKVMNRLQNQLKAEITKTADPIIQPSLTPTSQDGSINPMLCGQWQMP